MDIHHVTKRNRPVAFYNGKNLLSQLEPAFLVSPRLIDIPTTLEFYITDVLGFTNTSSYWPLLSNPRSCLTILCFVHFPKRSLLFRAVKKRRKIIEEIWSTKFCSDEWSAPRSRLFCSNWHLRLSAYFFKNIGGKKLDKNWRLNILRFTSQMDSPTFYDICGWLNQRPAIWVIFQRKCRLKFWNISTPQVHNWEYSTINQPFLFRSFTGKLRLVRTRFWSISLGESLPANVENAGLALRKQAWIFNLESTLPPARRVLRPVQRQAWLGSQISRRKQTSQKKRFKRHRAIYKRNDTASLAPGAQFFNVAKEHWRPRASDDDDDF